MSETQFQRNRLAARQAPPNLCPAAAQRWAKTSASRLYRRWQAFWHWFRQASHLRRSAARWRVLSIDRDERLRDLPLHGGAARDGLRHIRPYVRKDGAVVSPMRQPILTRKRLRRQSKSRLPQKGCLGFVCGNHRHASACHAWRSTVADCDANRLDKAETIELARGNLARDMYSAEAPSNAKATAARTLLELVGALGRHADPTALNTVPASEMSLEQLEARIAALVTH